MSRLEKDVGFITVNIGAADALVAEREGQGWLILRLPRFIASKDQFFDGVRETLPLDPPVLRNEIWDALEDSLGGGLCEVSENKILILWPNASGMKARAPEDFAIATAILEDLPDTLGNPELTAGSPKQLLVIQEV